MCECVLGSVGFSRLVMQKLKALVNIVVDRLKKKIRIMLADLYIIMFKWMSKWPKIQKKCIQYEVIYEIYIFIVYYNNYSIVAYGGNIKFLLF